MMCRRHHSAVVMVQVQRSKVVNTDGNNEWRSEIWRARLAWRFPVHDVTRREYLLPIYDHYVRTTLYH